MGLLELLFARIVRDNWGGVLGFGELGLRRSADITDPGAGISIRSASKCPGFMAINI
jgi:hypothetical protein